MQWAELLPETCRTKLDLSINKNLLLHLVGCLLYQRDRRDLADQGKCASDLRENLEDVVFCITKTAAITLQYRNSKHPSLPKQKLDVLGRWKSQMRAVVFRKEKFFRTVCISVCHTASNMLHNHTITTL